MNYTEYDVPGLDNATLKCKVISFKTLREIMSQPGFEAFDAFVESAFESLTWNGETYLAADLEELDAEIATSLLLTYAEGMGKKAVKLSRRPSRGGR